MLDEADRLIRALPPDQVGCLYHSPRQQAFVAPTDGDSPDAVPHFGCPGGVLPRVIEQV